nr:S8 family serine peptidase [Streptomyces glaucescens]
MAMVVATTTGLAPSAVAADAQSQQWYLGPMQAERMWKVSTGKGIKVAVIDSGVNADTPSLKGQVLVDEVPAAVAYRATDDYTGNGTTMAELIAGTGAGGGLKGLAPGARIVPYRVELETMQAEEREKEKTPDLSDAITAAADTDAQIISMSLSWRWFTGNDQAAIDYAASKGKLLIASVGDEVDEAGAGFPADNPYVVGVTSVDASGTVSKGVAQGYADLAAPGERIPSWCDADFRSYCVGDPDTRPAAALASAAAALIWSAHPDWTVNQVTRSLIDTASRSWAKDDPSRFAGYGLVRPRKVLENDDYDPGPPDIDPLADVNGGDLLAKSGATRSPAPADGKEATEDSGTVTSAMASPSNYYHPLWLSLSSVATVIGLATTGIAVLRLRQERRR